jgi:hypothetical protein
MFQRSDYEKSCIDKIIMFKNDFLNKTNYKNNMNDLLEQIDTIKEKITDQEYRVMMDSLKSLHDEKGKRYELTIGVIKNRRNEQIDNHCPLFDISIMRYIPKRFNEEQEIIDKYVRQTKENNGMLGSVIPLFICHWRGEVCIDLHHTEQLLKDCDEEDDGGTIVAQYVKYNLLAIREI